MARQNNNKNGFEPWDVLKRQHPELASDLIRIQILASIDPKSAEVLWNALAEKNSLPKGLFPQLLEALSQTQPEEGKKPEEKQKKKSRPKGSSYSRRQPHIFHAENPPTPKNQTAPVAISPLETSKPEEPENQSQPLKNKEEAKTIIQGESKQREQINIGQSDASLGQDSSIEAQTNEQEGIITPPTSQPIMESFVPPNPIRRPSTPPPTPSERPGREVIRPRQEERPVEFNPEPRPFNYTVTERTQTRERREPERQSYRNAGLEQPIRRRRQGNIVGSINKLYQNSTNTYRGGRIAGQLGVRVTTAAASNPYVWIVVAVIAAILLFIFILFVVMSGGGDNLATTTTCPNAQPQSTTPISGLTLTLTAPSEVDISQPITYSVNINYDPTIAKLPRDRITVYDFIPDNTTFASASGVFETQLIGSRSAILWNLKDNPENSISLSLKATREGICIVNIFSAVDSTVNIHEQQFPNETVPSNYQAAIKSEFGIQMDGFTADSLKWAYDTLKSVSTTKFISLQKGRVTKIFAKEYSPSDWSSNSAAEGVNCPRTIELVEGWPAPDAEEIFKITFIHEISHVIDKCAPESESFGRYSQGIDGFPEVYKKEGGATYYGQHANGVPDPSSISGPNMTPDSKCPSGNPLSEDYADMLAYYLNPNSRQKNVCQNPERLPNPYENGAHPLHKALAEKILKN